MQTITDLKRRALELREKTQVESITPDEVGTLAYDTLEAIENEQRSGASLGIRKTYVSIEAMEADAERPVDDKGTPLRRGMLANIYNPDDPESEDNGKVYSFENPGWAYRQYVTSGVASKRELDDAKKGANYQVIVFTKDVSTTRLLVPLANRKPGYMITYNPGTGWIEERYTGTLSIDSEWQKNENWKQTVSNENIENIALNAQAQASEAAKQAAFAKEQADRLAAIDLSLYRVVTDLPTQDIDEDKIYLKISTKTGENNKYDEYVYVDGAWELLGQYEAAIDLTQYVGKKELQSEIGKLPELANVSKFVCLDNEGKLAGVMSKEDVAKVLGELIGAVSENKDGLMPHKGFILRRSVPDLNTMDSGFARVDSDTANLPNGLTWKYGIAVTFRTDNVVGQLFFSSESGFFIRVLWDSWLEWIRL